LAGVELAQVRQTTVRTVLLSLLMVLAGAFASLFVCLLVIALSWESHRVLAIAGCAAFYVVLGVYFYIQLKDTLALQSPLFEATLAELGRDKQAILDSLGSESREQ
jgi:uncharacterized membrane protein YqjE